MSTPMIVGLVLGVITLFTLGFFLSFFFGGRPQRGWRWENEAIIIFGILMFHLCVWTVWPDWWVENIWSAWQFWILHVALITFAMMIPKGTTPFYHRLGQIGVPFVIVMMLVFLILKHGTNATPGTATTSQPAVKVAVVMAPIVPAWSMQIPTPGLLNFNPEKGLISVRLSNGKVVSGIGPDEGKKLGSTATIEFQSEGPDPVSVTVSK